MKSFLLSLFIVGSCAVAQASAYGYRTSSRLDIEPIEQGSYQSDLPVINGVRPCGGPGRVVEWRYEPCTGEGICKLPGDGQQRRSELEFIPSADIESLGVRINLVTPNGVQKIQERPVPDSAVQGGQAYVAHGAGGPSKEAIGMKFTIQYIFYRVDSGDVEVCAEADFEVVEP